MDAINKTKTLIANVSRKSHKFTVTTNNKVYVYNTPTREDLFKFIYHLNYDTWLKNVYYEHIHKSGYTPFIDSVDIPENIRLHLGFFLLDFGFYQFPMNTGIDSFVIFNSGSSELFRYTSVQTIEGIPTKIVDKVPEYLLYEVKEQKSKPHKFLHHVMTQMNKVTIHFSSINVSFDFDRM